MQELVDSLNLRSSTLSDYEKVEAIHGYICENVSYDYDRLQGLNEHWQAYSGYSALVEHNSVCQGISCMFYRLALEAGMDCRMIASDGELDHSWNIVRLDGAYYQIDCTWDMTDGTSAFFLRGRNDFYNHWNEDDQFQDASFARLYPLHDWGYGRGEDDTHVPDIPLITMDNKEITSTAAENGRAKVLIFSEAWCPHTKECLQMLRGEDFPGVDVLFCDTKLTYL